MSTFNYHTKGKGKGNKRWHGDDEEDGWDDHGSAPASHLAHLFTWLQYINFLKLMLCFKNFNIIPFHDNEPPIWLLGASWNPASSIPDISDLLSFTLISQAPVARAARWRPNHTGLTVGRSSLRRLRAAPWWARWTNGGGATSKVATPSMASSSRYLVSIGLDGIFIVCPL